MRDGFYEGATFLAQPEQGQTCPPAPQIDI